MTKQHSGSSTGCGAQFLAARENPLCMDLVTRIKYRFAAQDWPWHLERLRKLNYRAAVVGPQGSGKTTLLYELLEHFRGSGIACHHVFLPRDRASYPGLLEQAFQKSRADSILLVDGMERLNLSERWNLLRMTKRGPGLVVNRHRACRFPQKLPTWLKTQTCPELMSQILKDLNLDAPVIQSTGAAAFAKSNGNIREALRDLYDQFSSGRFNEILAR